MSSALEGREVLVHDMCLRDGMHAMRHQLTLEQMTTLAAAMDDAGVRLMQVTHGDGLGGSSRNYGFGLHTNEEYIGAVADVLTTPREPTAMEFPDPPGCPGTERMAEPSPFEPDTVPLLFEELSPGSNPIGAPEADPSSSAGASDCVASSVGRGSKGTAS